MKNISFLLLLSSIFLPSFAFAQEEELTVTTLEQQEVIKESDDISPQSPFYFLTEIFEDVELLLTFDEQKKVEKALEFAQKKLNGIENLNGEEDPKVMERLQNRFEKLVENAERVAQKENTMQEDSLQRIEEIRTRHLNVLNTVLEKAPEGQAQESLQKVIDKTIEKYNAKDDKVKINNKKAEVEDDIEDELEEDEEIEDEESE